MAVHRKDEFRRALGGGAVAGVIGGIVISLFMALAALAGGRDVWMGMKVAGAPLVGQDIIRPGFEAGPVLLGVAMHFAVSIGWGILFAALCYGMSRGSTMAAGAPFGVVVWLVMFYAVLPLFGMRAVADSVPVGMAVLEHVLFGLGLAVGFLPYQREVRAPVRGPAGERVL